MSYTVCFLVNPPCQLFDSLATDIDCAVIWEILNGCQEAAFDDIPSKYQDCLTIFNTKDSCFKGESLLQKVRRRNLLVANIAYILLRELLTTRDMMHSSKLQVPLRRCKIPQSVLACYFDLICGEARNHGLYPAL